MKARSILLAGLVLIGAGCSSTPQKPAQARCEEDQPCWDCHTMGNLICGSDLS